MNSLLSNSRENILNDESFIRLSPVDNLQTTTTKKRNKSAILNRLPSAVASTREANKLPVENNNDATQYPLTLTKEASIFDEFSGSINSTFIAENTIKTNLTEEHIIDSLADNVNFNKKDQTLAPLKRLKSANKNIDTENLISPFITISNEEKERLERFNKTAKIPPIKPIREKSFKTKSDQPISPVPSTSPPPPPPPPPHLNESQKPNSPVPFPIKSPEPDITHDHENENSMQENENKNDSNVELNQFEESRNYIEVKTEKTKKKYLFIALSVTALILIVLLIIILCVVIRTNTNPVAQMYIQLNTSNTTSTTTATSTTTSINTTTTSTTTSTTTTTSQWCQTTTTPAQSQIISSSYTCPYNTPYVAQFLSLANWYSYGYLINQQIACSNSIINLVCPTNQFIHIYAAYFGIQAKTLSNCVTLSATSPTNCFNKAVFTTINSTCEYQNNCTIIATVSRLGDPCFGNSKQLLIQYQCIDVNTINILNQCPINTNTSSACPYLNDSSIQEVQLCEPSIMTIQCTAPSLIQIVCAYYGIDSSYQCPGGNYAGAPTSCYSNSAKQTIMSGCNGKTMCQFNGNPNYQTNFTDPCYGFSKIMYVQYRCINSSSINSTTTTNPTTTTTTTLPVCPSTYIAPTGSCSSIASPYISTFLTANQTSFNYPIMQEIVCSGSSINLYCPSNSVIHIYSAYYGIQSDTSMSACFLSSGEKPALCYLTSSFAYINSTCEYQQTCLISASTTTLGDACSNYIEKQLFIQYQCVDDLALNSTINACNTVNTTTAPSICPAVTSGNSINEQVFCQNSTMNITCNSNKTITIVCAYYGLEPSLSASCGISSLAPNIPVCYLNSSFTSIQGLCTNKTSCGLNNFSTYFTDPCSSQTSEALYIQWKCS